MRLLENQRRDSPDLGCRHLTPPKAWIARAASWMAMTVIVGAATWGVRHATAPSVRRWHPGGGPSRRAGILQVRTLGSWEPVVLLLHGMAAAGNSYGSAFDGLGNSPGS